MNVSLFNDIQHIEKPVVTIGTFDGVHLGHRFILDHLVKRANDLKGESVVVTLWPHPRIVLNKDVWNFKLLHTLNEKIEQLSLAGIDHLVRIPFNANLASLSARQFLQHYLPDKLKIHTLLLGYDNRFGKDRQGDPEGLARCAEENRFNIEKLPEFDSKIGRINSTKIRKNLLEGNLKLAREMLGYDYYLTGTIVSGKRLGRDMGFPTANIQPADPYKLIPLDGVYAVFVEVNGIRYQGMLNIGFRPTIDSASPVKTIEVHILNFEGNLYEKTVRIDFIERVRDEMRFNNVDDLIHQLHNDKRQIIAILNNVKNNKL
ncbi:MAG TPA: bifunctional riboflavin kinase/FAD synthetase [Bacteroidaceae bacterium]|nr:bifunctional riboflavin kinase/FAD synthetase [Bacteroidaceae bacterium]